MKKIYYFTRALHLVFGILYFFIGLFAVYITWNDNSMSLSDSFQEILYYIEMENLYFFFIIIVLGFISILVFIFYNKLKLIGRAVGILLIGLAIYETLNNTYIMFDMSNIVQKSILLVCGVLFTLHTEKVKT